MAEEVKIVKYDYQGTFISNSRGMRLFTSRWKPVNQDPKALILLLHPYAMDCSTMLKDVAVRLTRAGYVVYGMDCEGHGKSSGLHGFIDKFDDVVNDYCDYFTKICDKEENRKKKRYLYGDAMGGAVALYMHRKMPGYWDGAVLVAPLCKITNDVRPSQFVVSAFNKLCKFFPTWKVLPAMETLDVTVRDPEKRALVRSNPYVYRGKVRLKTGNQLFYASLDLEQTLDQVALPFIVVHGGQDVLIDPIGSKMLFEQAASTDKTFRFYPEMCHALTIGEMPENIDRVLSDILDWLDKRTSPGGSRPEGEKEELNDDQPQLI